MVACGLIEAGGAMSVYRDGAFLWCAPTPSLQGFAYNPAEQVRRNLRGLSVAGGAMSVHRGGAFLWCAPRASHACTVGLHGLPAGCSFGSAPPGPANVHSHVDMQVDCHAAWSVGLHFGSWTCQRALACGHADGSSCSGVCWLALWIDVQVLRMPACPGCCGCQLTAGRCAQDYRPGQLQRLVRARVLFPHQQLGLKLAWQCRGRQNVLRKALLAWRIVVLFKDSSLLLFTSL